MQVQQQQQQQPTYGLSHYSTHRTHRSCCVQARRRTSPPPLAQTMHQQHTRVVPSKFIRSERVQNGQCAEDVSSFEGHGICCESGLVLIPPLCHLRRTQVTPIPHTMPTSHTALCCQERSLRFWKGESGSHTLCTTGSSSSSSSTSSMLRCFNSACLAQPRATSVKCTRLPAYAGRPRLAVVQRNTQHGKTTAQRHARSQPHSGVLDQQE